MSWVLGRSIVGLYYREIFVHALTSDHRFMVLVSCTERTISAHRKTSRQTHRQTENWKIRKEDGRGWRRNVNEQSSFSNVIHVE